MKLKKYAETALKICTALLFLVSLVLTFTVSDYYIFNRICEFGIFAICQWIKKSGLLLIALAVFYGKKSCSDTAKYFLPVFVIISSFTFGRFFDITAAASDSTPAELVYAHLNEFIPELLNKALFFISNALYLAICALLFVRDGYKVNFKSFTAAPAAVIACTPLNIFENFFDISTIPEDSILRFGNFTVWHFSALLFLAAFTIGFYFLLKGKAEQARNELLFGAVIVLLIQYHSKDSVVMGDGYNVYHTVFACVPLFICNIGVYVVSLSVLLKKRVLYSISFFVHAAGAFSVFVYFAKDSMSDYGIFCSYSILYFCFTHCLLFALAVMPSALGLYKFKIKDCIIPLIYYFVVIIIASVSSALVTSASMNFSYNGYTLSEGEWILPNYAFTQENPLPFTVPMVKLTIWRYDLSLLYILGLYAFYVGIFITFNALYFAFLFIRKKCGCH